MLPILNIGPLAIQTPGLILLLGVWIGLIAAERAARQSQYPTNKLYSLVLLALLAGLAGARLSFAAQYLSAFRSDPLGIFSPTPQMLDPLGGLVFAVFSALIFGQRKGLPLWRTLDVLTPGLAVFMIALGIANLASGDAFGAPTELPWGIFLWGDQRHPTQVYQILLAAIVAWIVRPGQQSLYKHDGIRFLLFCAASALTLIFIETFRGDSRTLVANLRINQVLAWFVLAGAIWLLQRRLSVGTDSVTSLRGD